MKKFLSAMLIIAVLGCMHSAVLAAELLDVKPVISGSTVSIEISADIPMTYTYYKVPGQARAVVDIAEADPEKVEPLIVVNKGAVSSISVDKAQISGIVVSRIIFNLVSESDISVTASADRKLLTVTFGGSTTASIKQEAKPESIPEPKPMELPENATKVEPPASAPETPSTGANKEDDPLGLDEPAAKPTPTETTSIVATSAAKAASETQLLTVPLVTRVPKLEPVVPDTVQTERASELSIREITTGATYIEIRANQPIKAYKATRLNNPDRLIIDIAGARIQQKPRAIPINKFGVTKTRIGVSPNNIRVVIDSAKVGFPAYKITNSDEGLRINFK